MNKKFMNLGFFIFSLCGLFILSCDASTSSSETDGQSPDSTKGKKDGGSNDSSSGKTVSKKTIDEAFLEVVKVLHAPYQSGDKFFKIFTGTSETNEEKDGTAVDMKDGDSSITGKGKWSVKAGKDNIKAAGKDNAIMYKYEGFQPKGSRIVIDGKMISMYRSSGGVVAGGGGDREQIGFNNRVVADSKVSDEGVKTLTSTVVTLADVLTISGEYEAKLEFIYPGNGIVSDVADDNYDDMLVPMFTRAGSSIEFTYDGKTKKITTEEEIKKLITVA